MILLFTVSRAPVPSSHLPRSPRATCRRSDGKCANRCSCGCHSRLGCWLDVPLHEIVRPLGFFPFLRGLAKTQSPSIGYGLVRLQRRRSSAMYSSIGTGGADASVLQTPGTRCQMDRVIFSSRFSKSTSCQRSASSPLTLRPLPHRTEPGSSDRQLAED